MRTKTGKLFKSTLRIRRSHATFLQLLCNHSLNSLVGFSQGLSHKAFWEIICAKFQGFQMKTTSVSWKIHFAYIKVSYWRSFLLHMYLFSRVVHNKNKSCLLALGEEKKKKEKKKNQQSKQTKTTKKPKNNNKITHTQTHTK